MKTLTKNIPTGTGKRSCPAAVKAKSTDGSYRWTISTNVVDSEGEVMVPKGCVYKDFLRNGGAMYWQHDTREFPIARIKSISLMDDEIEAEIVFPERPASLSPEAEWEPEYMRALVDAEMVKAVSVGFARVPGGTRAASSVDKSKYGTDAMIVTNKWRLGEVSFTTMPVNPEALRKAFDGSALTLAGCKSVLGIEFKEAPPRRERIVIRVPDVGLLDSLTVKAQERLAKARGRVFYP